MPRTWMQLSSLGVRYPPKRDSSFDEKDSSHKKAKSSSFHIKVTLVHGKGSSFRFDVNNFEFGVCPLTKDNAITR